MSKPIGLLGGTFDPVHAAHLQLAHEAMARLDLGQVVWIPSGVPGHRDAPGTSVDDRLAMLRLAVAGEPRFSVDERDARASTPTFTIETLTRLRAELGPDQPLVFLMGADQLKAFDRWRDWQRLPALAHFGVAERPGYDLDRAGLPAAVAAEVARREAPVERLRGSPAGSIVLFRMTPRDVSATALRAALARGEAPQALPAPVLAYIREHRLYGAAPASA